VIVDILPEISGIDFDRAWRRHVMEMIDARTGLEVHFISSADLIATKEAAGRAQDLADVERASEGASSATAHPAEAPACGNNEDAPETL
jgi:hypothetical protein